MKSIQQKYIALDPGSSDTKIAVMDPEGERFLTSEIRTAIATAKDFKASKSNIDLSKHLHAITINKNTYYVGDIAWILGSVYKHWECYNLLPKHRLVIFYGAFAKLLPPGQYCYDTILIGLPGIFFDDQGKSKIDTSCFDYYKGEHHFTFDGQDDFHITIRETELVSIPLGAYAPWYLEQFDKAPKGWVCGDAAVLDLRPNSLELYVIPAEEPIPQFITSWNLGTNSLYKMVAKPNQDCQQIEYYVRNWKAKIPREYIAAWRNEIIDALNSEMQDLKYSPLILAGGGIIFFINHVHLKDERQKQVNLLFNHEQINTTKGLTQWKMKRF